jgi:thiamine biosynthesis lipoprotein
MIRQCVRAFGLFAVMVSLLLVGACSGLRRSGGRFEYAKMIMGVEARIILYAPQEQAARTAARAAFDRMEHLEDVMSDYRPGSELMRTCREAAVNEPISISNDLYRVLARGRAIAEASGGAFDMTVGPLVRLWREARAEGRLPAPDALEAARTRVGWRAMLLDPERRTLTLTREGMRLDLGGIGKGFAADEALLVLRRGGLNRCLVDLGGDIALGEPPPDRRAWRIAIRCGWSGEESGLIKLSCAAVATSGDTHQFIDVGGEHYSHILDPRTGRGLTSRIAVTVIAPDATTADGLASAISVLGEEEGLKLLERFPGASALIERWTPQGIRHRRSESFPEPIGPEIR